MSHLGNRLVASRYAGTSGFTAAAVAPSSPPIAFSGANAGLLTSPYTSAPAGAVTINPGTDSLNALTASNPAGTTFYLLAGTHYPNGTAHATFDQVIPKNGNRYVGAPGAVLSGGGTGGAGNARYAFTGTASGVIVEYLEVTGFVCLINEFIINHDAGDNWTLRYLNCHDNLGTPVGLGSGTSLTYCWLHNNQQYGFSSFKAPQNGAVANAIDTVLVDYCEINANGDRTLELNPDGTPTGAGVCGAGKFWDTHNVTFTHCWVHDSNWVGLWADTNNVRFEIAFNLFENNFCEGVFYEISYNFDIHHNTLRGNAIGKGENWAGRSDNFPIAAIYISESGGDTAADATYGVSHIRNNVFHNNWGDITLWENADRFCNSLGNTSAKVWKPRNGIASLGACNVPTPKALTVTLTSGSPNFTVTSGSFESTDEGRAISGTGIPAGAKIVEPTTTSTPIGFIDATHGVMTANATTSGSVSATLAAGSINAAPYFSGCRWKTQNVHIHDNQLYHRPAEVLGSFVLPAGVRTGKVSILSQTGSFPSWSPYMGSIVPNAITFNQGNVWTNNAYDGPYTFMPFDTGGNVTPTAWRATPYSQDAGSTFV